MHRRLFISLPLMIAAQPAFSSQNTLELELGGSKVHIRMHEGADHARRDLIQRWINKSAEAVVTYYGKFPVPELLIDVSQFPGAGVRGGRMIPDKHMPRVHAAVGKQADEKSLLINDWVMVHEIIHNALPSLGQRGSWLMEGVSVYVESIARVMAGHLKETDIWPPFVKMMPRGWPANGEPGFASNGSWAARYWGGAAFCLACDVAMLRQSDGKIGLRTALRGINAITDARTFMPVEEVFALGDQVTGMTVLADMWNKMSDVATGPEIAPIFADLGVANSSEAIIDDKAPSAALRRAIFTA